MSKRFWVLNVVLAGLAVFLAVSLVRDLTHSRSLPQPPAPRRAPAGLPAHEAGESPIAAERLGTYNVIAAKHLFNPARVEGGPAPAAQAVPLPPKPLLLGLVVDGPLSRAYLEDPTTKRVFGYQIGDAVAGGRLEKIAGDRVVITRSDGSMEVLLRDPSKPKPVQPVAPAAQAPPSAGSPPASPGGRLPVPPRPVRRIPTEPSQEVQQ
jgi:hypothetical protein